MSDRRFSWKAGVNGLLRRVGYRITRAHNRLPGDDPIDDFVTATARLAQSWDTSQGPKAVHALAQLRGKPLPGGSDEYPHEFFQSHHNTYAPWRRDRDLAAWLKIVSPPYFRGPPASNSFTLVDIYRCWNIWTLSKKLARLSGDMIEVGTFRGGTAALIAHAIATQRSGSRLYICDTFKGVVKAGNRDTAYKGGEHADTSVELVQGLVERFLPRSQFDIMVGIFPEDSDGALDEKRFSFAHIDVDVYQGAVDCVHYLWPRLLPGGVIVFDDYGLQGTEGMTRAAEELAAEYDDILLVYNFNGQAMLHKMSLA